MSHLQIFPAPLRFTELPGGVIYMQLECNASEAGSLLFCYVCTKTHFLSNIFMATCKLFIVQRQRSSLRNCPNGFGKGWFHNCSTRNDGQYGQGKCCLEVVWKVTAWEALCAGCITSHVGRAKDHSLAATTFIRSAAVP